MGTCCALTYLVQSSLGGEDRDLVVVVRIRRHGAATGSQSKSSKNKSGLLLIKTEQNSAQQPSPFSVTSQANSVAKERCNSSRPLRKALYLFLSASEQYRRYSSGSFSWVAACSVRVDRPDDGCLCGNLLQYRPRFLRFRLSPELQSAQNRGGKL